MRVKEKLRYWKEIGYAKARKFTQIKKKYMNISTLIINIGFKSKILTQKIMEKKKQKKWKGNT